jgi:hypothetical protein
MKLLRVEFTDYCVHLGLGEDLPRVAPDVGHSWAIRTLFQLAKQVVKEAEATRVPKGTRAKRCAVVSLDSQTQTVYMSTDDVNPALARRIWQEFRQAVVQEQRRRAELAEAFNDPRPPQQEPQEQELEPEDQLALPWPPDPEEEARRLRAEVEALLRRRSGGSGSQG